MAESEKVITQDQKDLIKGEVGQVEGKGGDSPQTEVASETAKEDKVVPLKALLAEQEKRKSEKEARELRELEIQNLKAEIARISASQQRKDPFEGRDPYEPLTVAEFQSHVGNLEAKLADKMRYEKIKESGDRAREKYKGNKDLTFDDALRIFESSSFTNEERNAILASADPGERVYKYVKRFLKEKEEDSPVEKARDVAETITQNVNQAPTLSAATKTQSKTFNKLKELQKMTPAEMGRYLEDKVKSQRGG